MISTPFSSVTAKCSTSLEPTDTSGDRSEASLVPQVSQISLSSSPDGGNAEVQVESLVDLEASLDECIQTHSFQHREYAELMVNLKLLTQTLESIANPSTSTASYLTWLRGVDAPLHNHLRYLDRQDLHLRQLRTKTRQLQDTVLQQGMGVRRAPQGRVAAQARRIEAQMQQHRKQFETLQQQLYTYQTHISAQLKTHQCAIKDNEHLDLAEASSRGTGGGGGGPEETGGFPLLWEAFRSPRPQEEGSYLIVSLRAWRPMSPASQAAFRPRAAEPEPEPDELPSGTGPGCRETVQLPDFEDLAATIGKAAAPTTEAMPPPSPPPDGDGDGDAASISRI
ncbi:hypothetical protein PAPYR_7760 [Paratrimastix pyriformis]|uniref:Uncharacterized protein n=1 Tax=Paratrimastix pyriformis TaxID=342808 RepID=A0ABQ8UES2_9EUKA|nr:hypothetical protein PAPYR_7760 [Paratrimastix pyriformis]